MSALAGFEVFIAFGSDLPDGLATVVADNFMISIAVPIVGAMAGILAYKPFNWFLRVTDGLVILGDARAK